MHTQKAESYAARAHPLAIAVAANALPHECVVANTSLCCFGGLDDLPQLLFVVMSDTEAAQPSSQQVYEAACRERGVEPHREVFDELSASVGSLCNEQEIDCGGKYLNDAGALAVLDVVRPNITALQYLSFRSCSISDAVVLHLFELLTNCARMEAGSTAPCPTFPLSHIDLSDNLHIGEPSLIAFQQFLQQSSCAYPHLRSVSFSRTGADAAIVRRCNVDLRSICSRAATNSGRSPGTPRYQEKTLTNLPINRKLPRPQYRSAMEDYEAEQNPMTRTVELEVFAKRHPHSYTILQRSIAATGRTTDEINCVEYLEARFPKVGPDVILEAIRHYSTFRPLVALAQGRVSERLRKDLLLEICEMFRALDTKHDGVVTMDELKQTISPAGVDSVNYILQRTGQAEISRDMFIRMAAPYLNELKRKKRWH